MVVSRRTLLAGLALPTLSSFLACGRSDDTVTAAVLWSGLELRAFQKVVEAYSSRGGPRVALLSMGDDVDRVLSADVARASSPDLALISRQALITAHSTRLAALEPELTKNFPAPWQQLITANGAQRGFWFKVAHKSLIWYRPEIFRSANISVPTTWEEWLKVNRDLVNAGITPLAIGAADGWVLSDWLENVLLGVDSDTYYALADGVGDWRADAVHTALQLLGEMWGAPGVVLDGGHRALLSQAEQSVVDVFQRGRAAMVPGADFTHSVIFNVARPDAEAAWFPFPSPPGGTRPVVVGGDIAVLLEPVREVGHQLLSWLASAEAASVWARRGGFLSVNSQVPVDLYQDPLASQLLHEVIDGVDGRIALDLSDQMSGRLAGADGRGIWRILQDFFGAVTKTNGTSAAVKAAVQRTTDELAAASGVGSGD